MAEEFNPYHRWLRIPLAEMPLDYYRLLGLARFESDAAVIEQAAQQRTDSLKEHVAGPQAELATRVLGEITAARTCLLTSERKSIYDAKLRAKLATAKKPMPVAKPLPAAAPTTMPATAAVPGSLRTTEATPQVEVNNPPPFPTAVISGDSKKRSGQRGKPATGGNSLLVVGGAGLLGVAVAAIAAVIYLVNNDPPKNIAQQPVKPKPAVVSPPDPATKKPAEASKVNPTPAVAPANAPPAEPPLELASPTKKPVTTVDSPVAPIPTATPPVNSTEAPTSPPKPITEPAVAPPQEAPLVATDARLAIPSDAERQQAEREIRDVFTDSLAAAKKPEEKLTLSQELVQQGLDTNNSPAVRFAAFHLARSLVADAGSLDQALALIDTTGKHFALPVAAEKAALLTTVAEANAGAQRAPALAAARREFQALLQAEAYADAIEMGRCALQIAKAARDKSAVDQITASALELRNRQQAHGEFLAAQERLKTNGGDPQANLTVGRWLWFMKNDPAEALLHLSLASDEALATAATADLAEPADPKQKIALADQWRALAEKEIMTPRQALLSRAQHWYRQALPNAAGLDKARIEKFIAEIDRELPATNAAQVASNDSPSNDPFVRKPPIATPTSSGEKPKVEWKVPKTTANTAFRSFLGVYMYQEDRSKIYPVVNLELPNRNLWTQQIQNKVRGRISFDEISYAGTASFAIPADGIYILTMPDGKASINGKPTGGQGELAMVKGIHVFSFSVGSHGQPHIVQATLSLRHKETGEEVIFFNSWRDIQAFLASPIAGQRVLDVSDWKPTEAAEIRVDSKTLQVTNPNRVGM
jgi:hypothetical protein